MQLGDLKNAQVGRQRLAPELVSPLQARFVLPPQIRLQDQRIFASQVRGNVLHFISSAIPCRDHGGIVAARSILGENTLAHALRGLADGKSPPESTADAV